jgi:methionyl-tRNA formyltransferase
MKYIFFGTPSFAEIILERLLRADMPPAALVCNPDRPTGRKKIVTPPLTKRLVLSRGAEAPRIKIFQPENLDEYSIRELTALGADCFVVAAYAKIIPKSVLDLPRLGTIGVHPSLLPKYRGATPIQSAILNGERETGVTIYQMDEKMDRGSVLASAKIPIDSLEINYPELEERLAQRSAELLLETLPGLMAGKLKPHAQDEAQATYTKKFTTQDGFVDGANLDKALAGDAEQAEIIIRKIRALNPEPGCWTMKNAKRTKLLEAKLSGTHLVLAKIQNEGERARALQAGS